MTIRTFAEKHQLKITKDECGDEIIAGRRGHLYFDCGEFCLMVTDGQPAKRSSWQDVAGYGNCGGLLWMGDISPHPKTGKRVQDVSIRGVPLLNANLAIRMCRIKRRHLMSPARMAVLAKATEAGKIHRYGGQKNSPMPESFNARRLAPRAWWLASAATA